MSVFQFQTNLLILLNVLIVLSVVHFCAVESKRTFKTIEIDNGKIRGIQEKTVFGKNKFLSFRGIPFAKPPLDDLRFLPPQKPQKWDNVLDTIDFQNACLQIPTGYVDVIGSEDCLYLNVYTPDLSLAEKLPVIFFIHGGSFVEGSANGDLYGPDFLIDENVVVVTVQYRLAALGFMSLGTPKYSGNMGLKDQLMGLEWTNDNIHQFGGDPENITIFGQSAGSVIVHINTIVPKARKLFKRAILQSGSAFNYNIVDVVEHDHRNVMFEYARSMGKNIDNIDELIEFLKTTNQEMLYERTHFPFREPDLKIRKTLLLYKPIVEPENAEEPFLTDLPEDLITTLENPNIDIMFGWNSHEYMIFAAPEAHDPLSLIPFDEHFYLELPHRDFKLDFASKEYREMADKIRKFYFEDNPINKDSYNEYLRLLSDSLMFDRNINNAVKFYAEHNSGRTFYYRFSVDAKFNFFKMLIGLNDHNGTAHGDELCYIFKCGFLANQYQHFDELSLERQLIETMSYLLTNFAKFGNPTPNTLPLVWEPVETNNLHFLDIGNNGCVMHEDPIFDSFAFWDQLFEEYDHLKAFQVEIKEQHLYDEL